MTLCQYLAFQDGVVNQPLSLLIYERWVLRNESTRDRANATFH